MELVIDANILFAPLIKDGATIDLILARDTCLFVPEFIFEELLEHRKEILEKTRRSEGELDELMGLLQSLLIIFPKEDVMELIDEALDISPDPDDAPYIALALKLGVPIWSNDKRLKAQSKVEILSTGDLLGRGNTPSKAV
jgi:predicted nucleic acid-binding protein